MVVVLTAKLSLPGRSELIKRSCMHEAIVPDQYNLCIVRPSSTAGHDGATALLPLIDQAVFFALSSTFTLTTLPLSDTTNM